MDKDAKIYLAGHEGLVGAAVLCKLRDEGYRNIIIHSIQRLDLREQKNVDFFFAREKPEYVFLIAAKVGGILANINSPADFIYDNLLIQSNVINSSYKHGTKKLLFMSSSCCYPRLCSQPMKEEYILNGPFEPTNEYYAIAKVCGMKMIEAYNKQYSTDFFSLIFPNIYGIGDNFSSDSSHVVSALLRKMHEAKVADLPNVKIWGTGTARREFIFVDDVADACIFFMNNLNGMTFLNVGVGKDVCIKELAFLIKQVVGYKGNLVFDTSKPDGMPQKLLEISKMFELGWKPKIFLEEGIRRAYQGFIEGQKKT